MTGQGIVCLGIMVADVVGRPVRSIPAPGRLALVDEMSLHTGGCAINTATALARLGLPVEVIGKVGRDPFGDFLVQALVQRGIGSRGVLRDASAGTSATMVLVETDGERRFVHYIGANAYLRLDEVDMALVQAAHMVHIAGSLVLPGIDGAPTAELLRRARTAGAITFLDTVWDDTGRWLDVLAPCLPHIDYFAPSLAEAQAMTGLDDPGAAARYLVDRGVGTVALKMAEQGCLVMTADGAWLHEPAFVVEAVDGTGAGDAYVAGFMAGVYLGWPLPRTARFANAVGALCVTGVGASGGVADMAGTLAFMERTPTR